MLTYQETDPYRRSTPPTFVPKEDPRAPAPAAEDTADDPVPVRCRRCHRQLRDTDSVAAGIGPVCATKEGSAPVALPLLDRQVA